ncbi:MAG: dihydrodipicolinate reductase, partial [Phycisphaerae bacterium]|nr:dihydrodipicolinate reductase [Phycisphaerae bacterium]
MSTLKIIQIGVGPIGQKVVNYLLEREGMEVVAAVDPAPDKSGKDLGEVCGLDKPLGIIVSPNLADAMKTSKPDVAVLCTTSSMEKVVSQIEEIISHGLHVVSTCEELSYPWDTQPGLSKQLDKTARQAGVAVLGTGVNPGFLMDFLPLAMTAVCRKVESIKVSRIQDASVRRIPFQQKIGAGLTLEEFEAKKQTGTLRHVGLTESMQMIAARMGWKLDRTEDILTPVVAEREITTGYVPIKPGMAAGVRQIGKGYV